ncbi:MAG: homocysteine S-methyltransferase family protein [Ruminiclostridium sp.]|nr:homocysteine S-methyltransferase family protein [Ruminiclostridium sp.]
MTRKQFKEWVLQKVRILDGATGTFLQLNGMPAGVCPEKWVIENPNSLCEVQTEYIKNGSDIVYTFTFGANALKLKEYGIDDVEDYNRELAKLSKKVANGKAFVAGDIAPTGQMMEPFGMYSFEDIVNAYKRQVQGLLDGGVDLFVIETMMDIQEARAAVLAVKESCDLPVMATLTFASGGHTINGTDSLTALITLQSLGVDAFGCNCSTGPVEMLEIIRSIKPYSKVPLIAKPNAGLPKLIDGQTVFDMDAVEFSGYTVDFIKAGVNLVGGCCGTSPEYIRRVYEAAKGQNCEGIRADTDTRFISSSRKSISISDDLLFDELPVGAFGKRIDAKADENLKKELTENSMELVTEYAMEQIDDGALILNINAGSSELDETKTLVGIVKTLSQMTQVPLCLETQSTEALEQALRIYPGRALVLTEERSMDKLRPAILKYGAEATCKR